MSQNNVIKKFNCRKLFVTNCRFFVVFEGEIFQKVEKVIMLYEKNSSVNYKLAVS